MSRQPYRYELTHHAADIHEQWDDIEAGAETGVTVSVAGRVMLVRAQGKLAFATLKDMTGRIQLFALSAVTDRFEELSKLSIGDWVGATGEVVKTRKGELSVKVTSWSMLAETRRPFPDKWHGMSDPDTRYRQRYVDLWVSDESRAALTDRITMARLTRRWLEDRGFVEVDTPMLHPIQAGGYALPFTTHHNALDMDLYLRVAPELYLKRLVVGGFEKVFEMGRSFRNEGISPRHNPEFTNMEVYWAYADYTDMMQLVEELFAHLAIELRGTTKLTYAGRPVDLTPPWRRASMIDLIEEHAGVRVDLRMDRAELERICEDHNVSIKPDWGPGNIVFELYEKTVEANIWDPTFVCDYPKEVSPLSRDHRELPDIVERFELVATGRELCNAFSELTDPVEQRARFEEQAKAKAAGDAEAMDLDEDYVRALEYGLPPTAGLGVGIDRLAMLLTDSQNIRDITLFPTLRHEQP